MMVIRIGIIILEYQQKIFVVTKVPLLEKKHTSMKSLKPIRKQTNTLSQGILLSHWMKKLIIMERSGFTFYIKEKRIFKCGLAVSH